MKPQEVVVAGRPKSGTTWLCWILAALVDGSTSVGGGKCVVTSNFRIIRTHSRPHPLYSGLAVLIKRDPRDIVVSMHNRYKHIPMPQLIDGICVEWKTTLSVWRTVDPPPIETSYETLRLNGIDEVKRLGQLVFNLSVNDDQAYAALNAYVPPRKPRNVGDWRNDLDSESIAQIQDALGDIMEAEGYAF